MTSITGIAFQNLLYATGLAMLMTGLGYSFLHPRTTPRRWIARRAVAIMWGSAVLMAGLWWVLGVLRYQGFHTSLIDSGTFVNVLWNTLHGRIMGTAISWGTHFNQHFSPSLILVAVLYAPWQSPEWLIGLTAVTVASGGLALFFIARKLGFGDGTSFILGSLWLFSSLVRAPLLADFHETLVAAPLLLWVGYFVISGKTIPALLMALVALGFKEDMPVYVFGLGIILAGSFNLNRAGWMISALAVFYYAAVNPWLWNIITPMHLDFLAIRFPQLASQPGGVWASILSDPVVLFAPLLKWDQLWVVLMLFIPMLFLPLLRWGAFGLVPLLWLLLSLNDLSVLTLGIHYHLPILAVIVLSSISGYRYLIKHKPQLNELGKWAMFNFTICFIFAYPTSMTADRQLNPHFYQPHLYFGDVAQLANETEPEKSVMADIYLGTVFSSRLNIRHFPGDMLTDCIMISNRFMGNPVALLVIGGLNYENLANNPCFWFLSRGGTIDPQVSYMETMRWMEAEGCGFPPWGIVEDMRASGGRTIHIPAFAGYGDRIQQTPLLFLPPGKYSYSINIRSSCSEQNQPAVVLAVKELLPSGERIELESTVINTQIVNNRPFYQTLAVDFEVIQWGLTNLTINFGKMGSFWWDGVAVEGLNSDFTGLYRQLFVRETTAGNICLYPQARTSGDDPLFADAIAIDDEFSYRTICRWELGELEEGDYWIWYVDDIKKETAFYNWAKMYAVSIIHDGTAIRREIGTLEIERSEWTCEPNLRCFRAHLLPGERLEIDVGEGFPARVMLAKLWVMKDIPMNLNYFLE